MTFRVARRAPDERIFGRLASELVAELPERLSTRVLENARRIPDEPALVDGDIRWSYAELAREIGEACQWLVSLGIRPGDRVMMVGENSRALVAVLLAASELDAWVAIVNSRLSVKEIDLIRDHCLPRRVLYTSEASPDADEHGRRHGAESLVHPSLGALRVGALASSDPEPVSASGDEQVAAMIYTSGTTGTPKGVMLTHRGILYIASISGGMRHLGEGQRVYGVLPMSHVFGLSSVCMGSLYNGACLYTVPRFDAAMMLATLERERITVLQGVPAMYSRTLEFLRQRGQPLEAPALIYMSAGGSPMDADIKGRAEAVFGLTLHNGYGLTEASPTISQTRIDDRHASNTAGRVLPLLEYRLAPLDTGGDATEGEDEVGELWVRGPNVMKGYFRQPDATRAILTDDGWLNTGDIARFDEADQLYIVGRSKELIIRSGFNIYPPDVEAVINEHPDVTLSAVVGRQVSGNEEVVAFVQCEPGSNLDETTLHAFIAERLAPYKRPSQIVLMESLPATASGKILKGRLRDMAQGRDMP
ncbi:class I adenylate-forming enzyme family protein [Halomonas urumqiensis]|uniref:Long-chain fatty acid--CoA ligase n=1 Tax=Halomonas urumqiensis TaxID=1684789 RepID=A0A2N7ULV0_9GAMM|nr:class I adenylate-forming enzyme family protein [Halomonas urumqiensis]PMR81411.1 long-chain fatty acid--CoA ligase [Halomonas urumqiensis]PTB01211.1 long-chain fatty acid--CoA ligase [Halomonas urumqiensis]GHE22789.1 AMP-binding protein [Halomonas urumqiensis]